MNPRLLDALARGATAITPNRRLSRYLHHEFDLAQAAAGQVTWPTPSILPFNAWLQGMWDEVGERSAAAGNHALLTPPQSALLWQGVVDNDDLALLDARGAAALAQEAWTLAHAWGAGGESWRAWRATPDAGIDDPSRFASWAEAYRARLRSANAIDMAMLPDAMSPMLTASDVGGQSIALAGFLELTPQQERLFAALRAHGVSVERYDTLPLDAGATSRTTAPSPRHEVRAAFAWARDRVLRDPGARVAIVIEDLSRRHDAIVSLAEDVLCPATVLPGASRDNAMFEISLGVPLAQLAITNAALSLITLAEERLTVGAASTLVRSAYLDGAEMTWPQRAAIERDWLREGRADVDLAEAIRALQRRSPDLAARWRKARDDVPAARPSAMAPREWVDRWRAWLAAAGWPGTRPLNSEEFQAHQAWDRLLIQLATLGAVAPRLTRGHALAALRDACRENLFQPEGNQAPIQILGVLEASGMVFDAMWLAGFSAERWPPPANPNPLLPVAWQRERGVPRASAQRELAYAQTLTLHFARAAPEVVFSSARNVDDHEVAISALLLAYPERTPPPLATIWADRVAASATLERCLDERAPAIAAGASVPGGSNLISAQSDCPFQAVARHRLGASAWQEAVVGLSAPERGHIVHAMMAAFWGEVGDQATLLGLTPDATGAAIVRAVDAALTAVSSARWMLLPSAVRGGETRRLQALLEAWVDVERGRSPFAVRERERPTTLELAGLTFNFRFDRVDALGEGGVAIIDYKTGVAEKPKQWFDDRPRASQLGLYALAHDAIDASATVRAVANVQLRHDGVAAFGIARDSLAWPALMPIEDLARFASWDALEHWWRTRLEALAREIGEGVALVNPRVSPSPCRNCGLQSLCRIESVRLQEEEIESDD